MSKEFKNIKILKESNIIQSIEKKQLAAHYISRHICRLQCEAYNILMKKIFPNWPETTKTTFDQ